MDEYVKAVIGVVVVVDDDEDTTAVTRSSHMSAPISSSSAPVETALTAEASPKVRRCSRKRSQTSKGFNNDMKNKRATATTSAVHSPHCSPRAGAARTSTSPRGGGGNLGSNKRGSTTVWICPDNCSLTAVLTKRLVKSHWKCMCDIFNLVNDDSTSDGGVLKKGFLLVNDDDNVFRSISPPSRRRTNASSRMGTRSSTATAHFAAVNVTAPRPPPP